MKKLYLQLQRMGLGIALIAMMLSCNSELQITMPQGPQGPQGQAGVDGKSAYEVWKQAVENGVIVWNTDQTEVADFLIYIKGEAGTDGKSAYELWVDMVEEGQILDKEGNVWPDTKTSEHNFWEYLSGADGKNGTTPHIGPNGNWFTGTTDTGIPATGADGADGVSPEIGANGNWFVGTTDTNVPATGKSAYELWEEEIKSPAGLENPHDLGNNWDPDKDTLTDFWEYLRGPEGKCNCFVPKVNYLQPMFKATASTALSVDLPANWVNHNNYAAYEGFLFLPADAVTLQNADMVEQITIPFWRQRIEFNFSCDGSDVEVVLAGRPDLSGSWVDELNSDVDYGISETGGVYTHKFRLSFKANDLPDEKFRELTLRFRKVSNPGLYKDIKIRQVYLPNVMSRYSKANVAELNTFGAEITEANFATLTGDQVGYRYSWGRNIPLKWGVARTTEAATVSDDDVQLWDDTKFLNGGFSSLAAGTSWSSKVANATSAPASYVGANNNASTKYSGPASVNPGVSPYGDPCPAGWHLPNRDEYYTVAIGMKNVSGYEQVRFTNNLSLTAREGNEGVLNDAYSGVRWDYWTRTRNNGTANTTIGRRDGSYAQYKGSESRTLDVTGAASFEYFKPIYAIKFISSGTYNVFEDALRTAFKYEVKKTSDDNFYLKISSRHLGEYSTMTAAELETQSGAGFWESNNANDVTVIVPFYGVGHPTTAYAYSNVHSYVWSSEIRTISTGAPNSVTFLTDGPLSISSTSTTASGGTRRASASAAWSFGNSTPSMLRCVKNAQDPELSGVATTLPVWQ